ncbi:PIN domain-like protein [Pholiota conissans]|uniref:PIN domain-like protein n=1 Tax=Pholiota conissans TaxID=109636 RepID=A0A9P5YLP7_9AGAR|nr:PIN domain-like protein [Pholiota conissans]
MGVPDMWRVLLPASQMRTLTQVAVTEGFEQPHRPERCLRLGVDASIWMNQAQLAIRKGKGTRGGENPAVRILFNRLCRLLTLPIIPIFVFDGPARPSKKQGVNVNHAKPHWLTPSFQKFVEAFGFFHHTAPSEAEAELAELDMRNHVDAILSEDSDALVFGAQHVIRMKNYKNVGDQVTIFKAEDIAKHPLVQLNRSGLFLVAILCGGDYNQGGLNGCGEVIARRLAQTDLAESLYAAATCSQARSALRRLLPGWRESLRTLLRENPGNVVGKKYPQVADALTDDFPPIDILTLYATPLTSWTATHITAPNTTSWILEHPDITKIGNLCEKYFSWGSSGEIAKRFEKKLWPGVSIRAVLQLALDPDPIALHDIDVIAPKGICSLHVLNIHRIKFGPLAKSMRPDVSGYTAEISTFGLLQDAIAGLGGALQTHTMETIPTKMVKTSLWIPASILGAAMHGVVADFHRRTKSKIPVSASHPPVGHYSFHSLT